MTSSDLARMTVVLFVVLAVQNTLLDSVRVGRGAPRRHAAVAGGGRVHGRS